MTEILADRLIRHEGLRLGPYKDSRGYLTIGVGRCLDTKGITKQEALYLLSNDLNDCEHKVFDALPWALDIDEARQSVLVEMAFQLGLQGLLQFKNMLSKLQAKDYAGAAKAMLSSAWHTQTPNRCEELAEIMLNASTDVVMLS